MAEFACIAMRGYSVCRDLVCALFVDLHWPSLHPFICNVFDFFINESHKSPNRYSLINKGQKNLQR